MNKFKVGDVVRCAKVIGMNDAIVENARVVYCNSNKNRCIVTANNIHGHTGDGKYKFENCWWVNEENLELVHRLEVGDTVRILDGDGVEDYEGGWVSGRSGMDDFVGKTATVERINEYDNGVELSGVTDISYWGWDIRYLEYVPKEKASDAPYNNEIVINTDGKSVIATLTATGERGEAKCHPDDEFDYEAGAKLALTRLFEKARKPEALNCKFVVAKSENDSFTVGKIYEVVDGRFSIYDDLFPLSTNCLTSFDELEAYLGDGSVKCACGYFDRVCPTEIIQIVE